MENELSSEWLRLQRETVNEIEQVVRKVDFNTMNILAIAVAGLCDVDVADMLSSSNRLHISQSRWLFWYALRWYSNDTYTQISEKTAFDGHRFGFRSVADGITKMSDLIDIDHAWKNRWVIIKKIIKSIKEKDIL